MRIGVFNQGWWRPACEALGLACMELPAPVGHGDNSHYFTGGMQAPAADLFAGSLAHAARGDAFDLIGRGWDTAYGLAAKTPFPSIDAYFQHFRDTAININLVGGNAESGLNMRHFEITAAGGFMLCYHQPELADHFVIGKECDVFCSEHELVEKIRHYLTHPKQRAAIACAGQTRTLARHLYSHRLEAVLRLVSARTPHVAAAGVTDPVSAPSEGRTVAGRNRGSATAPTLAHGLDRRVGFDGSGASAVDTGVRQRPGEACARTRRSNSTAVAS